jgi:hypothetical protein
MVAAGEEEEHAVSASTGRVSPSEGVQIDIGEYDDEADEDSGAHPADDSGDGGASCPALPATAPASPTSPGRDTVTKQRRTGSGALLVPEQQKQAMLDEMLREASPRRRWSPEVHTPGAASTRRNAERLANLIRPQAVPVRVRAPGDFEQELRDMVLLPSKIREGRLAAEKAAAKAAAAALAQPRADAARKSGNKPWVFKLTRKLSSKGSLYTQGSQSSLGEDDMPGSVAAAASGGLGAYNALQATGREIVADILSKSSQRKTTDLTVGAGDYKAAATLNATSTGAGKGSARHEEHVRMHKVAQKDIATKYGMTIAEFSARTGIPVSELVELERGEFYRLKQLLKGVLEESLDLQEDVRQAVYRFRSKAVQHVDSKALSNLGWKEAVAPLVRSEAQVIMSWYQEAVEKQQAEQQAKEEMEKDVSPPGSPSSKRRSDAAALDQDTGAQVQSQGAEALSSSGAGIALRSVLPTARSPPSRSSKRGPQTAAASPTRDRREPHVRR